MRTFLPSRLVCVAKLTLVLVLLVSSRAFAADGAPITVQQQEAQPAGQSGARNDVLRPQADEDATASKKPAAEPKAIAAEPKDTEAKPNVEATPQNPATKLLGKVKSFLRSDKKGFRRLNITFAHDPGKGAYDGVVGKPTDHWNFIEHHQTSSAYLRSADGTSTSVNVQVSENDGEWGIEGQSGIYHAYVYHNCRCVDLSVTFDTLPPGIYNFYVYAHGDAPNQNAAIRIKSGAVTQTGKATLNDGTWDFRSRELTDGNQFVRYLVEVQDDSPVVITSLRDGSPYSMFNAIQIERVR